MTKSRKSTALAIYIIIFYALWAAFELVGKDLLGAVVPGGTASQLLKSGVIKNLVWTLPALLLARRFRDELYIPHREMFTAKVNWLKYLPIFALFTLYILAADILQTGRVAIADSFGAEDLIVVLFVGLTEETVFRGWLLNATLREEKKWPAILLNALMFLAIHFPVWIHNGIFLSSFASLGFVEVMVLSVIFSLTFVRSRNILVPIALHMYWDLLVMMLI